MSSTQEPLISFISLPNRYLSIHPPFNLLNLATYLDFTLDSVRSEIVEFSRESVFETSEIGGEPSSWKDKLNKRILDHLINTRPRYIGVGGYTNDYNDMLALANSIRGHPTLADSIVIAGNVHATLLPSDFIYPGSPFDFAVIGEGELTLSELISVIEDRGDLSSVRGIAYVHEGSMRATPPRPLIANLDDLPIVDYSKIDLSPRTSLKLLRTFPARGLGVYTGRGCPFTCTYCASNSVWNTNESSGVGATRFRSVQSIVEEIRLLKDTLEVEAFYIMDDTFTLRRRRIFEFCDEIEPLEMIWGAQSRVSVIDDELVRRMRASGCIQLDFGVESGSQRMLDVVKKKQKVEQASAAFSTCHRHGVRALANLMINLPGESVADIRATKEWVKANRPDEIMAAVTTPYPGTELYDKLVTPKLERSEYVLLEDREVKERFRFADHDLDLYEVHFKIANIGRLVPSSLRVLALREYRRYLWKTQEKREHLSLALEDGLGRLVRGCLKRVLPPFLIRALKKRSVAAARRARQAAGSL